MRSRGSLWTRRPWARNPMVRGFYGPKAWACDEWSADRANKIVARWRLFRPGQWRPHLRPYGHPSPGYTPKLPARIGSMHRLFA